MIQSNLQLGEEQKLYGLDLVEFNGENFVHLMRKLARRILVEQVSTITIDDLRIIANKYDIKPHSCNCWGAIFRGKQFKAVGFQKSTIVSNHARRIIVWGLA